MAMAVGISAGFPSRRKRESARAPGLPDRTPFLFDLSQDTRNRSSRRVGLLG